jgi:hypothetical protein
MDTAPMTNGIVLWNSMMRDANDDESVMVVMEWKWRAIVYIMYNILKYKIAPLKNTPTPALLFIPIAGCYGHSELFCTRAKKISPRN